MSDSQKPCNCAIEIYLFDPICKNQKVNNWDDEVVNQRIKEEDNLATNIHNFERKNLLL